MGRTPIHPGDILGEELETRGVAPGELASALRVPTGVVQGVVDGRAAVTAELALRLGRWFGTSPEFWLNLQKAYELRCARQAIGAELDSIPRRPALEVRDGDPL